MSDTNYTIEELKKAASEKFSQTEIENFITLGKQLASKAVITALINVVKDGPGKNKSVAECNRLVKKLGTKMPYNYCGYVQCEFKETPHKLNISLSIVPKTYEPDIEVPSQDFASEIFTKYEFLKKTATAYYLQFCEENTELFKRIIAYRDDLDLSELVIDEKSPATMYFDPESTTRIGVFPYWINGATGQPFRKDPTKK